tara:strand:- start:95 stop:484 length:390 start_codon:yes stop_codon:yes gene_type:complete
MSQYAKTAKQGTQRASSYLKKGEKSAKQAKIRNVNVEELQVLASISKVESDLYNSFKERYDKIMSNDSIAKLLEGRGDIPTAQEVYRGKDIPLTDKYSIPLNQLEAISTLKEFKKDGTLQDITKLILGE